MTKKKAVSPKEKSAMVAIIKRNKRSCVIIGTALLVCIIFCFRVYGLTMESALLTCLLFLLAMASMVDVEERRIPNLVNFAIFSLGMSQMLLHTITKVNMTYLDVGFMSRGWGMIFLPGLMLLMDIFMEGAFGMGDVKLCAATGFCLGFMTSFIGAIVGLLIAGICGTVLILTKKAGPKEHFALGPFLALGFALVMLFPESLAI